jgi:hypothetical protein
MTVESASHIDELVAANPAAGGPAGEGDDHLRLIKSVLLEDFANISEPVTATAAELNYLDIDTPGTAAASKALTADVSANVNAAALTWTDLGEVTTVDINGGSIDGAIIGANSAAAGTFTNLTVSGTVTGIDQQVTITNVIADVSTAETILIPIPVTGTVSAVYSVLEGAITVADATVTLVTSADAAMASLVITQSGSAAGDVDSDASITNASVTAGDYLKLATDGGSTTAQRLWVTILIDT